MTFSGCFALFENKVNFLTLITLLGWTKHDKTYVFKISIKIQFFWCIYWYQNSVFSFGYYWAGSLIYNKLFDRKKRANTKRHQKEIFRRKCEIHRLFISAKTTMNEMPTTFVEKSQIIFTTLLKKVPVIVSFRRTAPLQTSLSARGICETYYHR